MANEQSENNKQKENNKDAGIKPDPETLNTTDPQEHMEGPVSSLMRKTGESFESEESEEEVKKKKRISKRQALQKKEKYSQPKGSN